MSTKHTNPCILNAANDEPLFVLRAQDKLAPLVIEFWIKLGKELGVPVDKLVDAREVSDEMSKWRLLNRGKLPD